jgi:hypothetical protein
MVLAGGVCLGHVMIPYLYRSLASHGVFVSVIDPANISSPTTMMAALGASMCPELAALAAMREWLTCRDDFLSSGTT